LQRGDAISTSLLAIRWQNAAISAIADDMVRAAMLDTKRVPTAEIVPI